MNRRHIIQFDSTRSLHSESIPYPSPPSSTDQRAAHSSPGIHPPSSLRTALTLNVMDAHAREGEILQSHVTGRYRHWQDEGGYTVLLRLPCPLPTLLAPSAGMTWTRPSKHLGDVSETKIDMPHSRLQIPSHRAELRVLGAVLFGCAFDT